MAREGYHILVWSLGDRCGIVGFGNAFGLVGVEGRDGSRFEDRLDRWRKAMQVSGEALWMRWNGFVVDHGVAREVEGKTLGKAILGKRDRPFRSAVRTKNTSPEYFIHTECVASRALHQFGPVPPMLTDLRSKPVPLTPSLTTAQRMAILLHADPGEV